MAKLFIEVDLEGCLKELKKDLQELNYRATLAKNKLDSATTSIDIMEALKFEKLAVDRLAEAMGLYEGIQATLERDEDVYVDGRWDKIKDYLYAMTPRTGGDNAR